MSWLPFSTLFQLQAVKTAVGAITPLEPFKLWHSIGENVRKAKLEIEKLKLERMEQVSVPGRSNQGVGIAQIGFACFWPNGGGLLPVTAGNSPSMENDNSQARPQLATTMEEPASVSN